VVGMRSHTFVKIRWRECRHNVQHALKIDPQIISTCASRMSGSHFADSNQLFDNWKIAMGISFFHDLL
jgi:hypothetical protein